ncbi:hypothetical protein KAJ27_19940 [bacterium]|nr:hypothetical protein [bacterium]
MRNRWYFILVLLVLIIIQFSEKILFCTMSHDAVKKRLPQYECKFGILTKGLNGKEIFEATTKVPFIVGQRYGWILTTESKVKIIRWTEELILPSSPKTWGITEESHVSSDKTITVTNSKSSVINGEISNFWSIADGDPKGKYQIRLYVEDKFIEEFNFTLVEPKK